VSTELAIGIAGLAGLFLLLAVGIPVGVALIAVGVVGIAVLNSVPAALATLSGEAFVIGTFYELLVIPLFVLMGNYAALAGMSGDLYRAAYSWVGHWRGGLASATILACAGFAALSGSSVASAVTMGRVALPEMSRYRYAPALATGSIAAGGTLGILIPPSTGFVVYALLTEQSIGRLFLAGVIPGLLMTGLFILAIAIETRRKPMLGPAGPRVPALDRWRDLWRAGAMIGIAVATIGGIYGGVFTPVEAAGVGAVMALAVVVARRRLTGAGQARVMLETARTTALAFLILIGAHVFGPFLALSRIPGSLAEGLAALDLGPGLVLLMVLVGYVVLGTFLEGFAMLVLTVPIVLPILEAGGVPAWLGLAAGGSDFQIWFGVVMVIVLEMGLISPPVGVNVFVVKGIAEDVPLAEIFRGILPFWLAMGAAVAFLVAWPELALFLPNTMIR